MASRIPRYGWLLAGGIVAIAVPASGLDAWIARRLAIIWPFGVASLASGVALFSLATALHFRYHWVRCLTDHATARQQRLAAVRLLDEARRDGIRWLRVIQENLELLVETEQRPADARMYLGGARAHADKLEQAFVRIDGVMRRLSEAQADGLDGNVVTLGDESRG